MSVRRGCAASSPAACCRSMSSHSSMTSFQYEYFSGGRIRTRCTTYLVLVSAVPAGTKRYAARKGFPRICQAFFVCIRHQRSKIKDRIESSKIAMHGSPPPSPSTRHPPGKWKPKSKATAVGKERSLVVQTKEKAMMMTPAKPSRNNALARARATKKLVLALPRQRRKKMHDIQARTDTAAAAAVHRHLDRHHEISPGERKRKRRRRAAGLSRHFQDCVHA